MKHWKMQQIATCYLIKSVKKYKLLMLDYLNWLRVTQLHLKAFIQDYELCILFIIIIIHLFFIFSALFFQINVPASINKAQIQSSIFLFVSILFFFNPGYHIHSFILPQQKHLFFQSLGLQFHDRQQILISYMKSKTTIQFHVSTKPRIL
ncbi:unnamed protein product [Paramecium octaurelia]|uniref:Transmembrane protein n=1 Tax=Paramecium octaurelia TaxID=43137 RepID=A0A8S1UMD4_PAROT|nr:unnamed protein product [Paramecium octaurelia]